MLGEEITDIERKNEEQIKNRKKRRIVIQGFNCFDDRIQSSTFVVNVVRVTIALCQLLTLLFTKDTLLFKLF